MREIDSINTHSSQNTFLKGDRSLSYNSITKRLQALSQISVLIFSTSSSSPY
jgi:hypothetical protein